MSFARIYIIKNIINSKVYVGFTRQKNLNRRLLQHKGDAKANSYPSKLHRAMTKYGAENFYIEDIYCSQDIEHCLHVMEKYFIAVFNSLNEGYNTVNGSVGCVGVKRSQKHKDTLRNYMKNRIVSDKTRKAMSVAAKKRCKEHFNLFVEGAKSYKIETKEGTAIIRNLKEYARQQGTTRSVLGYSLKRNKEHHGYKVSFA